MARKEVGGGFIPHLGVVFPPTTKGLWSLGIYPTMLVHLSALREASWSMLMSTSSSQMPLMCE